MDAAQGKLIISHEHFHKHLIDRKKIKKTIIIKNRIGVPARWLQTAHNPQRCENNNADFGLSKSFQTEGNDTHMSTIVAGTIGYLDPE